jgi:hypothetical protein
MTPPISHQAALAEDYRALHKYLRDRFADTVVLTFGQIEDLLGFKLPSLARVDLAWWATADAYSARSPQSLSWTDANRTAAPRLPAQIVVFERIPV